MIFRLVICICYSYKKQRMKDNLQIFRECSRQCLPSQQIQSLEQFKELTTYLCDNKLLHPSQVKKLEHKLSNSKDIKFPLNFQQLELIIMTQFGDKNLMDMLQSFKNLKIKLRQVKGVLNIWKDKGLSKKERLELQSIFEQGNSKIRELFQTVKKEKHILQHIYEQEQQMIDSLDQWVKMQKIEQPFKDHKEYLSFHQKLIQQQFSRFRVREVHFRQKVNTNKITKIQSTVGMDSRNDDPVEVTFVPKRMLDFQALNTQLLTFNARKQLMMSPHFARFFGYSTSADPNCFFYFSQLIEGTNLNHFISNSQVELQEDTPLFKYWAAMMFQTFWDIFLKCSFIAQLPLTFQDFQVGSCGLKLVAKGIKFIDYRDKSQGQFYEAELLENLGVLILGLLNVDPKHWGKQTKVKRIQNKNILSCLLNAPTGHKNFREKRVKSQLSFFNCQTHPLFQSPNLTMGQTIISNFESILNYH